MKQNHLLLLGGTLALLAIATRFIDHPANFTAVGAVALLSGYYFQKKWSWIVPLAVLFVSDMIIGFYDWQVMASVYAGFLLMWGVGYLTQNYFAKPSLLVPASFISAAVFFILTNVSVWAFSGLYPLTFSGLTGAFLMAVPFFKWTVAGNLFYTTVLVGIMETAKLAADRKQQVFSSAHS